MTSFGMQRWKEEGEKNSKEHKPEDMGSEGSGIGVVNMTYDYGRSGAVVETSGKLRNAELEGFQRAKA